MRLIIGLVFVVIACGTVQAQGADWKLYGSATVDAQDSQCFYDDEGVIRGPDKRIKVWTKCFVQKDFDSFDKDLQAKIIENSAQKVARYYIPPIAKVKEYTFDETIDIVTIEVIAGLAHIQPQTRILYELNCADRMLRELSIYVRMNNKDGFKNSPSEWRHVSPETNGNALLIILCHP